MEDYEPPPIAGYRPLTEREIDMMNHVKIQGMAIGMMLDSLEATEGIDKRWLAIARTHLQEGFMFVCRAIGRPEGF